MLSGRVRGIVVSEGPAAARIVVTVAVAWQVALWLGARQPPVYAALVPLVALRGDPVTALATSLQRVLGVVAGVLLGVAVLNVLHPSTAALALVVALGLGAGMFLRGGGPLNVQVPVSSLLVFASASPDAYALDRLWETGAGAVVTVLLAPLLWPPDPARALAALLDDCCARTAQALERTAAVVGAEAGAVQDNVGFVVDCVEAIRKNAVRAGEAERAMRFNPLRWRHRDAVKAMARSVGTADRIAPHLAALAGEAAAFSGRADLVPVLADARRRLPPLAAATARAVTQALTAGGPGPALAAAEDGLAAYIADDPRPAAVALRRPLRQILDGLGQGSAS